MKYKEIYTLTRPDATVSFFPEGSIHAPAAGDDFTDTVAYRHFIETYVDTGKCDLTSPSLSEDGLTLTYTTVYTTVETITELKSDPIYADSDQVDLPYHAAHNITSSQDLTTI